MKTGRRRIGLWDYLLGGLALAGLAGVILGAHLALGWTPLWPKLALIPVLLAAWRFGLLGGAVAAAIATATLAPQLLTYWGELDVFGWADIAELIVLNVVGWTFGVAMDYYRRSARRAEALTRELGAANAELAELVALRERAAHLERLETVNRLAGGVAHELRNPLAAIKLTAQTVDHQALDEETRRALGVIEEEVERADAVIRRLLGRSRDVEGGGRFDLTALLREALAEIEPRRGSLTIETSLPEGNWRVTGEAQAVKQALVNLLVNAIEAAEERINVELRASRRERDATARRRAVIVIDDDGPGVAAADVPRLFEPFFTTKSRGTGLGLYLAAQTARGCGGTLEYAPNPLGGARFTLRLPLAGD